MRMRGDGPGNGYNDGGLVPDRDAVVKITGSSSPRVRDHIEVRGLPRITSSIAPTKYPGSETPSSPLSGLPSTIINGNTNEESTTQPVHVFNGQAATDRIRTATGGTTDPTDQATQKETSRHKKVWWRRDKRADREEERTTQQVVPPNDVSSIPDAAGTGGEPPREGGGRTENPGDEGRPVFSLAQIRHAYLLDLDRRAEELKRTGDSDRSGNFLVLSDTRPLPLPADKAAALFIEAERSETSLQAVIERSVREYGLLSMYQRWGHQVWLFDVLKKKPEMLMWTHEDVGPSAPLPEREARLEIPTSNEVLSYLDNLIPQAPKTPHYRPTEPLEEVLSRYDAQMRARENELKKHAVFEIPRLKLNAIDSAVLLSESQQSGHDSVRAITRALIVVGRLSAVRRAGHLVMLHDNLKNTQTVWGG